MDAAQSGQFGCKRLILLSSFDSGLFHPPFPGYRFGVSAFFVYRDDECLSNLID